MINKKNKIGVLFTITTIFLLLSLYLLTRAFFDRTRELQNVISSSIFGDKFNFIEDDIISNSYKELLDINLEGVERGSRVIVKFGQFFLSRSRNYNANVLHYKTLIENKYAKLNNLNIILSGFNSSFILLPYNTTFELSSNLTIFTMPTSKNYINSITAYIKLNDTFSCDGAVCEDQLEADEKACQAPGNDPQGSSVITITWEERNGLTCSKSRRLIADENNDKGNGKQFYVTLLNGDIEIKYGSVDGINGIFLVLTNNINSITANITQLDLEYSLLNESIVIKGGTLKIISDLNNVTKMSNIILYKE